MMTALPGGLGPKVASHCLICGTEEVAGIQFVGGRLADVEMRGRGPVRPGLLAERERLQVVAVLLDDGGRTDLDRRIAREHRRASVDDVAEEYDPAEAERGGARHDAWLDRMVTQIRIRLVRRDSPLRR